MTPSSSPHSNGRIDLDDFRELGENWDGGAPITNEAITTAENLAAVPTSDGGVQLEIHAGGADVEVVIAPDGRITAVCWEAL
jgi:hypothetical protein